MSVYVGIDLHRKRSQVAVAGGDGRVQLNRNVVNGVIASRLSALVRPVEKSFARVAPRLAPAARSLGQRNAPGCQRVAGRRGNAGHRWMRPVPGGRRAWIV